MLINKDAKPADSIYYISCCIIEELKSLKTFFVAEGFNIIKEKYNSSLKYTDYLLALNFLFLIDKVSLVKERLHYVY